ncbi:MAG TPA: hypothetical protein ENI15_06770 [Spirochaetes bacterium]|nr:hypothetical protein [Spirochaetota bacterium]
MEIKKSEITAPAAKSVTKDVKVGQLLRVRVLRSLGKGKFLVEFKGKTHNAILNRNISSRLFMAKVVKVSPGLELKYVKKLELPNFSTGNNNLLALLNTKKPFIQKLITSDNFLVSLFVFIQKNKKNNKKIVQNSVKNQNISHILNKKKLTLNKAVEYYILQNLYNMMNDNENIFLFPLRVDDNSYLCDLKISEEKNSIDNSFFLSITLDEERKIGFLVYFDYEAIVCYVSTNDQKLKCILRSNAEILINHLKSVNYNKKVEVAFVPFREQAFYSANSLKKIDIKM